MDEFRPIFWRISDSRLNRVHLKYRPILFFIREEPVSGDDAVVAYILYRWNGRQGRRKRNREPFRSHSRYRHLNRILHVRLSYPLLSCAGLRCPLLSNIHRAHVISSFLYPFSLPVYWAIFYPFLQVYARIRVRAAFSSKNIRNGSHSHDKSSLFSRKRLRDAFKRVKCK